MSRGYIKKKTMALIKCKECGFEVSDKSFSCPKCGSPIEKEIVCSECGEKLGPNDKVCPQCGCPIKADDTTKSSECNFDMYPTTDTGTSNEETLKSLGDGIYFCTLFICIVGIFFFVIWGLADAEPKALLGILGLILLILQAKIIRAFILVLHNMSINLHEINMKLK